MKDHSLDESKFSMNERPQEYQVCVRFEGETYMTIMADSAAEAREKADDMLDRNDLDIDIDDTSLVEIRHVLKSPPLYRVTRDGQKMQVSRLEPGDLPRDPDEHGF